MMTRPSIHFKLVQMLDSFILAQIKHFRTKIAYVWCENDITLNMHTIYFVLL